MLALYISFYFLWSLFHAVHNAVLDPAKRTELLLSTWPRNREHIILPLRRDLSRPVAISDTMESDLALLVLLHIWAIDSIIKDLASFLW